MGMSADDLPPQMRQQLQRLQQMQQQAQMIIQQRLQLEMQVRELDKTLEELEKIASDAPIYRSAGALLVRAKGRDEVKTELGEEKETAEVKLQSLKKQEAKVKESLTALQSELQSALNSLQQGAGGSTPRPAAPAGTPAGSSRRSSKQ
ncbi:MAG: prefoldin subunit beta [Euryarchaeota archaeon]|nr:prefoldin subunit beta [Euryarchaeota archaeon]